MDPDAGNTRVNLLRWKFPTCTYRDGEDGSATNMKPLLGVLHGANASGVGTVENKGSGVTCFPITPATSGVSVWVIGIEDKSDPDHPQQLLSAAIQSGGVGNSGPYMPAYSYSCSDGPANGRCVIYEYPSDMREGGRYINGKDSKFTMTVEYDSKSSTYLLIIKDR